MVLLVLNPMLDKRDKSLIDVQEVGTEMYRLMRNLLWIRSVDLKIKFQLIPAKF